VIRDIAAIATIVGSCVAVVGLIMAVRDVHKHPKKPRSTGPKHGLRPKAFELIIKIRLPSWVFLFTGCALVALSMGIDTFVPPAVHDPASNLRHGKYFNVMANYHPSGFMGDIGDLKPPARMAGMDRFIYEPMGMGPHEWEYKYVEGALNEKPAQFAGIMYLSPPGNFGTDPNGGHDLADVADVLRWDARSIEQDVHVEFLIGGITWVWDELARKKVQAPYPDSLPNTSLGAKKLTPQWRTFEVDLRERGRVRGDFRRTIGGFGWVITWAANGLEATDDGLEPTEKKTFTIELRNICYERKQQ